MGRYKQKSKFIDKWTKEIQAHGFTELPNLLIEFQGELKITPTEMCVLIAILKFQWDKKHPFPSVGTISKYIGKSPLTVTRCITSLDNKNLLQRVERSGRTNEYIVSEKLGSKLIGLWRTKELQGHKRQGHKDRNDSTPPSKQTHEEYEPNEYTLKSSLTDSEMIEGSGYKSAKKMRDEIEKRVKSKKQGR